MTTSQVRTDLAPHALAGHLRAELHTSADPYETALCLMWVYPTGMIDTTIVAPPSGRSSLPEVDSLARRGSA
jgi:hypothetical protein